jgi:2-phosphoglycerate kinase
MVLEGVHLVPGMLTTPARALVVHVVLGIENEDIHAQHFWIRDADSAGTRAHDKYLDRLSDIRHIQDFIVDEAGKTGVPVIQNGNIEQAIGEVLDLVFKSVESVESVA